MSATELTEVILLKLDDIWRETNKNHMRAISYGIVFGLATTYQQQKEGKGGGGVRPAPASLTWGLAGLAVVLSSMLPEAFEALALT